MKQCTLLCRRDTPPAILQVTAEYLRAAPTIDGFPADWSAIMVEDGGYRIRLVRTRHVAAGDDLSRTLLGMVNWLERVALPNPHATRLAVRRVLETKVMIGLTGTPELSEERGHFDYIFALAASLDALVWNGSALFTPEGDLLINAIGESEV